MSISKNLFWKTFYEFRNTFCENFILGNLFQNTFKMFEKLHFENFVPKFLFRKSLLKILKNLFRKVFRIYNLKITFLKMVISKFEGVREEILWVERVKAYKKMENTVSINAITSYFSAEFSLKKVFQALKNNCMFSEHLQIIFKKLAK